MGISHHWDNLGWICLFKKWTTLDSFSGLFVETAVLVMLIPLLLITLPVTLSLPAGISNSELALLGLCGLFSVIPLTLFSFAASRLRLSLMGFFQFVLPLTQLFCCTGRLPSTDYIQYFIVFCCYWVELSVDYAGIIFRYSKFKHRKNFNIKNSK